MIRVATRDLRNDTAGLLRRVAAGEDVVITVRGEPVARLVLVSSPRRRWLPRQELVARLRLAQADPGMRQDLERIAGDITDDLGAVG
jgi:prevent-host-death family protein